MKLTFDRVMELKQAMFVKAAEHAVGMNRGLIRAGLWLQRESQKIVPVDTAALKNSARTRSEGVGFDTIVTVSYSTDYAMYVHEDLVARHKKGKQAKYLEDPARYGRKKMQQIVRKSVSSGAGKSISNLDSNPGAGT